MEAKSCGMGIEVVSPFELKAASLMGFDAQQTLVNGPQKHRWLGNERRPLNVVFDSLTEISLLRNTARAAQWRVGLRIAVANQADPDTPEYPAQFGLDPADVDAAIALLNDAQVHVNVVHFHLRSNVPSLSEYRTAATEVAATCERCQIGPEILDIGGGLREEMIGASELAPSLAFDLEDYVYAVADCAAEFNSVREIWLENGRYLASASGILIITVCDIKRIRGYRFLICDGGRTNHALESDWASHAVVPLRTIKDKRQVEPTIICGPTCMAYDWIYRGSFPSEIQPGDRLAYLNAGAYHLPWETRFSYGLCKVVWTDDGTNLKVIRAAETFDHWISQWN
jgi:diaminopimelate decarboxylase